MNGIPALLRVFAYLSLLTVGGGMAAFPELKTLTVDVHHWLTFPQLIHLYSLGQVMPGPNMMMIIPIGDWVAGPLGAVLVAAAFFGPTALLTYFVGVWWDRLAAWPWRASIQRGLAPVSIGLLFAGCISIGRGAIVSPATAILAIAVLAILLVSKINPAVLVIGGGVIGILLFR